MRSTLAGGPEAPAHARQVLDRVLADDVRCGAACLAVSELVSNAVIHGRIRAEDRIELSLLVRGAIVRVSVAHQGDGFTVPSAAHNGDREGGWGLEIVDTLALAWGTYAEGGRTVVWFEL